jgi:hypothetical protein
VLKIIKSSPKPKGSIHDQYHSFGYTRFKMKDSKEKGKQINYLKNPRLLCRDSKPYPIYLAP